MNHERQSPYSSVLGTAAVIAVGTGEAEEEDEGYLR
jgi:hypothetical protein